MRNGDKVWDESTALAAADSANLDLVVDEKEDKTESVPLNTHDVSFYSVDYPVDGLVKRLNSEVIRIPRVGDEVPDDEYDEDNQDTIEGFQREFLWGKPKSDKFIESLLMGLPVPGIFLAKTKSGSLLVLDGQQRLITLQKFYENRSLGDWVQETYRGKTYETLSEKERRRLDDSLIHATVIEQKSPHGYGSLYHIFERLNSGGKILTPQQIRMALHHGALAKMLIKLNKDDIWRKLIRRSKADLYSKDMEMILRFFALFYNLHNYKNPMKNFLNEFMEEHDNMNDAEQKRYEQLFCATVVFIHQFMGDSAFCGRGKRPSAPIMDSLMYGVAKRLTDGALDWSPEEVKNAMKTMLANPEYQKATSERTSTIEHVNQRLNLSAQTFCGK